MRGVSIIEPLVIDMNEARVRTLEQVRQVVAGTQALEFRSADDDKGRYAWIEQVLKRFGYLTLLPEAMAMVLTGMLADQVEAIMAAKVVGPAVDDDVEESRIRGDTTIKEVELLQLIKARVVQGIFCGLVKLRKPAGPPPVPDAQNFGPPKSSR